MVVKVIQPGAYWLKDDNGNILTNTWSIEQLRHFFPKARSYHFFPFNVCSYSTLARALSARVARGLHGGVIPPSFFTIM